MAAGLYGVIAFGIYVVAAFSVVMDGAVGGNQDLHSSVLPLFPVGVDVAVGVAVVVKLLYIAAHAVCQIRLYKSGHGGHIVDLGRAVFQSVVVPQPFHYCGVDHGAAHASEIHRYLVRLFVSECGLYSFS